MDVDKFTISNNPSPRELTEGLAVVTNTIAYLAEQCAALKNIMADAEDTYKQLADEKLLMYSEQNPKATQVKLKALVNTDDDVVKARAVWLKAKADTLTMDTRYKSWDNRFICLRKIASIKTIEMQTIER